MTEITENEAIAAIAALLPPQREPGWVSSKDMAKAWGITQGAAAARLNTLHGKGKVERRLVLDGTRPTFVYRMVEGSNENPPGG